MGRGGNEICASDSGRPTDRPAQVLGWGDYVKPELILHGYETRSRRSPKPPGISVEPAHRTWVHPLQVRAKESFEIATNIAYLNRKLRGSPKDGNVDYWTLSRRILQLNFYDHEPQVNGLPTHAVIVFQ